MSFFSLPQDIRSHVWRITRFLHARDLVSHLLMKQAENAECFGWYRGVAPDRVREVNYKVSPRKLLVFEWDRRSRADPHTYQVATKTIEAMETVKVSITFHGAASSAIC